MIDRTTIDKIMDATNIVEVVSDFVSLRKRGTSYKGLCPFHDDKTPSFSVSPSRGVYKCFSCGKSGNAVGFIMEHEQMTYPEALKWLAHKYHIEIEERELTDEEKLVQSERESMFIVNEWAADYFHNILLDDVDGRAIGMQYFRSRGFRDDIIERFKLGFALSQRDAMASAALKKGYQKEFLIKTGLCGERDEGLIYDRFAGRVIFPWMGVSGKVTAFGGRLLDSRTKGVTQKYVNSPDSDIYHKDHELYGIYQAKKAITKEDRVYMVEGYTDVISMHQCGIENVVANSGTALSVFQIKLLRRFTQNITLLYDGDEAGIHAAMRGTDMLLAEGMNIKVLLLPDQEDPDSFARKHTASDFRQYIEENQVDFMEFKTTLMLKNVIDPIKRSEAINNIVKSISVIQDPIVRATYIKECSIRVGMQEQMLINQMNKFIRDDKKNNIPKQSKDEGGEVPSYPNPVNRLIPARQTPAISSTPKEQSEKVERMLIQMVVRHGEEIIFKDVEDENGNKMDISVAQYIQYDLWNNKLEFSNPLYSRILEEAFEHNNEEGFRAEDYFTHHPDFEINQLATEMSIDIVQLSPSMQIKHEEESLRAKVVHLVLDFQRDYVESKLLGLERQLKAGTSEDTMELTKELMKCYSMRSEIAKKLGRVLK